MVPAQPVDATPSNALIRQCFPGRSDLFGCPRSKPSQGSVPADLTLASDLAFVFNASQVRLECCVDPLRPPDLSGPNPRICFLDAGIISLLEFVLPFLAHLRSNPNDLRPAGFNCVNDVDVVHV